LGAIGKVFLVTAVSTNVHLVDSKTQREEETASTPLLVNNFLRMSQENNLEAPSLYLV